MDGNVADRKQKIRDRYKGVSEAVLDVIPAAPQEDFYRSEVKKRVAVYARVSTDDPNQTSSYELQKNHYEDMVNQRANWELVGIYADEGISGTSLLHRDSFVRMIADCREGKIDLIVTKSVSRFARNIVDCISYVRQLKAGNPPVGVFFETENIFTLDDKSEMSLSFIATLAQEESHNKSDIMNSSVEMRFKRGIFLTPVLLGYDHDENGNLVINEDEANTVRLIFFSYLYGYSSYKIADALTELERLTKKGNRHWSSGSVLDILTNERYCGDVLARKTYTPNYLDHKSKKNLNKRNQYRQKKHHEGIISREDFFAVQKMIRNAKYGNKGYFPEIHVIGSGLLKGYVTVHPKWAGFSVDDYYTAVECKNKPDSENSMNVVEVCVRKGDFNLSGYELVRSEFLSPYGQMFVTIKPTSISFNKMSILQMAQVKKIELVVSPTEQRLAIRRASEESHYALDWYNFSSGKLNPKSIGGSAFLPTLYKLFGWDEGTSYKIKGTAYKYRDDVVIIYDVKRAGKLVAEDNPKDLAMDNLKRSAEDGANAHENMADKSISGNGLDTVKRKVRKRLVYPENWEDSFGDSYYRHAALSIAEDEKMKSRDDAEDVSDSVYSLDDGKVTTQKEAAKKIEDILKKIGAEDG